MHHQEQKPFLLSDPKIVDSLLNKEMQPLTPYTITDAETLSIQMNKIRIRVLPLPRGNFRCGKCDGCLDL